MNCISLDLPAYCLTYFLIQVADQTGGLRPIERLSL